MSEDTDKFIWTPELTEQFFHIRLQHEWLFQKKKQAWKTLHGIMLQQGFPTSMTVSHLRKKWSYTIEEYRKASTLSNKKWIYFHIFHSYLGTANDLEGCPNWPSKWIEKLIELRIKNEEVFTTATISEGWVAVEIQLREAGLPTDCSVRKIDQLWNSLTKTFKSRNKFGGGVSEVKSQWPFYQLMQQYYESCQPDELESPSKSTRLKADVIRVATKDEGDSESDNDCLIDVKERLTNNLEKLGRQIKAEQDYQSDEKNLNEADDDEFRWTPGWTESFIHMRLQNEWLFKQKKQAWKDLHYIMMDNGFPTAMTVTHIRRKWHQIHDDYRNAVVKNNTKWIYFDVIHGYLSKVKFVRPLENWPDEWVRRLIQIRTSKNLLFVNAKLEDDDCWGVVEAELRADNIPSKCSLRNIHTMWTKLCKKFKVKHRYINNTGSKFKEWKFYEDMKKFYEKCDPCVLSNKKNIECVTLQDVHASDNDDDAFFSEEFDKSQNDKPIKKEEPLSEVCRACLSSDEAMSPLFHSDGSPFLSEKIMACTAIQVSSKDNFPQYLCADCTRQLDAAFKFKIKVEETDKLLRASWSKKTDFVSNVIKEEVCHTDDKEFGNLLLDNDIPMDYDSDTSLPNVLAKCETDLLKSNIMNHAKRKVKKAKIKEMNTAVKKIRRSKNLVLIPVVTESGETVYKRRYKYFKICDVCGRKTQRMKEHMKGHSSVRSHICPKCPKTFTYSASLQTHLRTHESTPLKICQHCGKEFFRNLTYKRHLVYHANERKFPCETCGKAFNTNDILKVHVRSHTGERPYACKICGKAFLSRGCVARHQKVHRKQLS